METQQIQGLSTAEVQNKKKLGLTNEVIDSYTPSTFIIFRRNIFSLINVVVFPLLITLVFYKLYTDVFAFSTFLIINTLISISDEFRIKKQLEKLKNEFQQKVIVIRDGKEEEIPTIDIVEGDFIKSKEGEGVITDGEIVQESYLQIDESALNGESNYIRKYEGEKIYSGSYIVTGSCIYKVLNVGKNNYLNKLGSEALKFKEKRSQMQVSGDKLILFLVFAALIMGVLNFYLSSFGNATIEERVLGLTTVISLIIPQTLIFLFTLTFTISITKLYNKGILVQKGGSIEDLSNINVICFDKTGTITTNEMKIVDVEYFNTNELEVSTVYNSLKDKIVSVNKTQEIINKYFGNAKKLNHSDFDQVPFTSKNKYSLISANFDNTYKSIVFGAYSMLKERISSELDQKIEKYVSEQESNGNRVLVGLYFESSNKLIDTNNKTFDLNKDLNSIITLQTAKVIVFTIEETLNPGIKTIIEDLKSQNIQVKIISGDSLQSVSRVMQKLGLSTDRIIDLSETNNDLKDLVTDNDIFTRAKPEDKLTIIKALQANGLKVAMVGDGINDVLSLKASDVSIAMEGGSKITREVSDIVLLNNDYQKIPLIFFEGENIIFNLKMTTKMFLVKSFFAILTTLYFSLNYLRFPLEPASTLIFSFLGTSAPSYVLVFTRQKVSKSISFFRDVLSGSIPISILYAAIFIAFYLNLKNSTTLNFTQVNTVLIILVLCLTITYSLFLIWEAKKLKNILVVVFFYALVVLVGTFETILPLNPQSRTPQELITILGALIIAALIIVATQFAIIKPKKIIHKLAIILTGVIFVTVVSIFPFQTYYEVQSFPASIHLLINAVAIATIPVVALLTFLSRKLVSNIK